MKSKAAIITLLAAHFSLFAPLLLAQEFDFVQKVSPFPMQGRNGEAVDFPFLGGFNAPRPQLVDIDGDGDLDLFIQEESASSDSPGRLMYFENIGTPQIFKYVWRTNAYQDLDVGNWYKFIDMDADGDFDLFTENSLGSIRYWQNSGGANQAGFVLTADSLRDAQNALIVFDVGSLPEIADIDCDGDADLFIGRSAAGTISFYENIGLSAQDIPIFKFVTDSFQDISIIGQAIGNSAPTTDNTGETRALARHGNSSLSIVDINNDLDSDIFWGDFFETSLIFLENSGNCAVPDIAITSREFPLQEPLLSAGFNAPRFDDIDADGDLDMFVAVLGGAFAPTGNLASNLYFYRNTGSSTAPAFALVDTQFVSMLDVAAHAMPAFVDIDNDGDLDMFIGNEADPDSPLTAQSARLYFFENNGAVDAPEFALASKDYLENDFSFSFAPTFADIDGDNDFDLFIGDWSGRLAFLENTGSAGSPDFPTVIENYADIDVGNYCTPAFIDIDADGDLDLFTGELDGSLNFYRNTATASVPVFFLEDEKFATIDMGDYSTPFFKDVDNDGDWDLLVGSDANGLMLFRNTGTAKNPVFAQDSALSVKVQSRSAPALVDVDADGDLDLFVGSEKGGLLFFDNLEPEESTPVDFALLQNYPNPFNSGTTILFGTEKGVLAAADASQLAIYNLNGQMIREWSFADTGNSALQTIHWDGTDALGNNVSSGVYFSRLRSHSGRVVTGKMLLLR